MPETPLQLVDIHPKMYITTETARGSKVMGWVKRVENRNIILDKAMPYVDDRENDDSDSMGMEIEYEDNNNEEVILNWGSISYVFEVIIPFPFDADKNRVWKAKAKCGLRELQFKGHGVGFKPNMNLGSYNVQWLHGKTKDVEKMSEYDMQQVKELLPDNDITQLFYQGTTEKRLGRERGTEKVKRRNDEGVLGEVDGKWEKYKRYAGVLEFTPSLFQVFQAAKLGTLMFAKTGSIKKLFEDDMFGQA